MVYVHDEEGVLVNLFMEGEVGNLCFLFAWDDET